MFYEYPYGVLPYMWIRVKCEKCGYDYSFLIEMLLIAIIIYPLLIICVTVESNLDFFLHYPYLVVATVFLIGFFFSWLLFYWLISSLIFETYWHKRIMKKHRKRKK